MDHNSKPVLRNSNNSFSSEIQAYLENEEEEAQQLLLQKSWKIISGRQMQAVASH
jgi:hypothetical protein